MDHQTNYNCLVLEQVMFDRSWKLNLLSAHSEFFVIWLSICSRTKYAIMKKLKRTRFFLGRFEILKKKKYNFFVSYCS